ncbi:ABC transporter [Brevibacterium iodinum ATCC 49514]|uniref:ABC transporter n=1 Tax=Brevibacterium iodinum ATCC 49514 TaxID=1255616 RepID=A0A2H1HY80_9MICO|nr:ATP-binding cassette domain-containing protein [Brevibacterium iodinum]SMX67895.1 ABC transporter [Brevibacterium iodinum ATCC 49514]SUW13794.1 cytochrome c biogenesis protein CcmA [Brevibacterium iodinum]
MESTTDTFAEDTDIDAPAVVLRGWSLSGKQGDVFTDIDLEVPTGAIAVVRGPAGSGKTSLLLSLAGRMRVSAGEGRLGAIDIRKQARTVRGQVAVGHIGGLTDLEDDFTVAQHVAERQIMLQPWYKPWASKSTLREVIALIRETFTTAGEMVDDLPPGTLSKQDAQRADFLIDDDGEVFVSELSELQKFFLEFGLASLSRPPVVVIDNIDYLRESADRARAWAGILIYQQLRRSRDREDPLTVIVSCEDSSELDIATRSLGFRAEPSLVDLELPPHSPAHRGSEH